VKLHFQQLEISVTTACLNFCVGCNHFCGIAKPSFMPLEIFKRDVLAISHVATVGKFALLGGEPTLHQDLAEMIKFSKLMGFAAQVSVVTNGQKLRSLPEAFWQNAVKIELDAYPGKLPPEDVAWIREKCRVHNINLLVVEPKLFYKCLSRGQTPEQIQQRFNRCPTGHKCYCIDYGHFFRCPQAALMPELILGREHGLDGLKLDGITVEKIQAYLDNKAALNSCARCSVEEEWFPWCEQRDKAKWLEESTL
jgi:hypothetical protein